MFYYIYYIFILLYLNTRILWFQSSASLLSLYPKRFYDELSSGLVLRLQRSLIRMKVIAIKQAVLARH